MRARPIRARRDVVRRLVRLYRWGRHRGLGRPCWYDRQRAEVAGILDGLRFPWEPAPFALGTALDAAAVLSPMVSWETVLDRLPGFLAAVAAGREPDRFHYRRVHRQAVDVLLGRTVPTGPKVSRFARNLRGDPRPVTVDRWAVRAAEGRGARVRSGRHYRQLERDYRAAARLVRAAPSAFQAVVWEVVRGPGEDSGIPA